MKKALFAIIAMAAVFLLAGMPERENQAIANFEEVQALETTPVQTSILQNVAEMRQGKFNDVRVEQEETAFSAQLAQGLNNMQQHVANAPPNESKFESEKIIAKIMKTTAPLSTRSATAAARSIGEFRLT